MEWTKRKDVMMAREVLYLEPFRYKDRTTQGVEAWQDVVTKLTENYPGQFDRLTSRGLKDHMGLSIKNQKKKNAAELRASGISPVPTELDQLLDEIIEKMDCQNAENEKEKEKKKKEEVAAKDMRLKAMENLSQTKKREAKEEQDTPKRRRSNGSEMVTFLRERADEQMAQRTKEANKQDDLLKVMSAQQQQQQAFAQQQQKLHQEAMKQQNNQFAQMQQMMAQQQQQNFQMLMAILQKKN